MADSNGTGSAPLARPHFDTSRTRLRRSWNGAAGYGDGAAPAAASARRYLRSGLPAIYHESDFGVRFVGALELLLDPVVAQLDCLASYLKPDLAPTHMLELLAAWLGLELDESWPDERRRELVRRGAELTRRRGTLGGLELTLRLAFPELPLRCEDGGRVAFASGDEPVEPVGPATFIVYCDRPLAPPQQAAVARVIENAKPVGVTYRLRVKAASS